MRASASTMIPRSSSPCATRPGALAEAKALAQRGDTSLPLYGVPFAVKDNIDVTACRPPPRARTSPTPPKPMRPAWRGCARRVRFRWARPLDQFATGLVGVRSPYGVPRNAFDPKAHPGGSSSGSGVAVAAGLVPFSLGTDTAGSGRVPAGLGNIVGLEAEPRRGLDRRSRSPACRTLDASRCSRSPSTMPGRRLRTWPVPTSPTPTRAIARSARSGRCRRCASACRSKGRACSSATRCRRRSSRPRSRASQSSAPWSARSTSSRSTRPRGCSTRDRGSRSATTRCAS